MIQRLRNYQASDFVNPNIGGDVKFSEFSSSLRIAAEAGKVLAEQTLKAGAKAARRLYDLYTTASRKEGSGLVATANEDAEMGFTTRTARIENSHDGELGLQITYDRNVCEHGAIVVSIQPGSKAAKTCIELGDVIVGINGRFMLQRPYGELLNALQAARGGTLVLKVSPMGQVNHVMQHWVNDTDSSIGDMLGFPDIESDVEFETTPHAVEHFGTSTPLTTARQASGEYTPEEKDLQVEIKAHDVKEVDWTSSSPNRLFKATTKRDALKKSAPCTSIMPAARRLHYDEKHLKPTLARVSSSELNESTWSRARIEKLPIAVEHQRALSTTGTKAQRPSQFSHKHVFRENKVDVKMLNNSGSEAGPVSKIETTSIIHSHRSGASTGGVRTAAAMAAARSSYIFREEKELINDPELDEFLSLESMVSMNSPTRLAKINHHKTSMESFSRSRAARIRAGKEADELEGRFAENRRELLLLDDRISEAITGLTGDGHDGQCGTVNLTTKSVARAMWDNDDSCLNKSMHTAALAAAMAEHQSQIPRPVNTSTAFPSSEANEVEQSRNRSIREEKKANCWSQIRPKNGTPPNSELKQLHKSQSSTFWSTKLKRDGASPQVISNPWIEAGTTHDRGAPPQQPRIPDSGIRKSTPKRGEVRPREGLHQPRRKQSSFALKQVGYVTTTANNPTGSHSDAWSSN